LTGIAETIASDLIPVLSETLPGTISGFLDFMFGAMTAGITFFVDTITETMPNIELFSLSLGALGETLPALASSLSDALSPAINTLLVGLTSLTDWVATTMIPDLSALLTAFGTFWTEEIGPFLESKAFTKIGEAATWLYEKIGEVIDLIYTKVWDFIEGDFWDAIVDVFGQVTGALDDIIPLLEEHWPAVMEYILGVIESFGIDIVEMIDLAKVGFLHSIGETGEAIKELWASETIGLWDKIKISMGLGLDALWKGIKDFFAPTLEALGGLFEALLPILSPIAEAFKVALIIPLARLKVVFGAITIAANILTRVIEALSYPFKWLATVIHNFGELIKHPFSPNKRDNWSYPKLAKGGQLLTDGLVFGHQDETMIPAKVAPLPTNLGNNSPIEIVNHMTLEVDGRTLAKVVTREKRHQEKLMTGSSNGRRWEMVNG